MPKSKPESSTDRPFGVDPQRPAWPLVVLIVAFVLWFGFLAWMAVQFPAR